MISFRYLFLLLSILMLSKLSFGNIKLDSICKEIDNEYINLKYKDYNSDTLLFNDLLELTLSIKIEESISIENRVTYLTQLNFFLKSANNSLYINNKLKDKSLHKAIRFYPTIIWGLEKNNLSSIIPYYQKDLINAIRLLPKNEALKVLAEIVSSNPRLILEQFEELNGYLNIDNVIENLAKTHPKAFIEYYELYSVLKNNSKNSNIIFEKILKIYNTLGVKSNNYAFINDIIYSNIPLEIEIDFNKEKISNTKKLVEVILKENYLGKHSAIELLIQKGIWVIEDYSDYGKKTLNNFTINELLCIVIFSSNKIDVNNLTSILRYISEKKDEKIDINTIKIIPKINFEKFYLILQKNNLENEFVSILTPEALNFYYENYKYKNDFKPEIKYSHWFSNNIDFEKIENLRINIYETENKNSKFGLKKTQYTLLNWTRNLNKIDSNFLQLVNSSFGNQLIEYLSKNHPQILLNNINKLKDRRDFEKILNRLLLDGPNNVKNYLSNNNHIIYASLKNNQSLSNNVVSQIYNNYKFNTKAYSLIDKYYKQEKTIDQLHHISQNQYSYLKELCDISVSKSPIALVNVETEQNVLSLKIIREINDNPITSNKSLQELQQFNPKQLYSLMILGREELFDFTFSQLYKPFRDKLGVFKINDFFNSVNNYRFREFCNLLLEFNKFSDFLNNNSTKIEKAKFIENMLQFDFKDINFLEQASIVSEIISKCDDESIQIMIQNQIYINYKKAELYKDQLALAIYSVLACNIGKRAIVNKVWYNAMAVVYDEHVHNNIKINDLKNKNGKIVEVCFFYDDSDGKMSYNSFLKSYENNPNWIIQDIGNYMYISSMYGNNVEIFSNKPNIEAKSQESLLEYFKINKIEPSIVVHRGHSYHSQKTIDKILGSPKFIFMGSCGGYYKIPELMQRSPSAHILSTKQVGTMRVNDPVLKNFNENLRMNFDIEWDLFWNDQKMLLGKVKDFKDYVPPHKNSSSLFINAFFDVVR